VVIAVGREEVDSLNPIMAEEGTLIIPQKYSNSTITISKLSYMNPRLERGHSCTEWQSLSAAQRQAIFQEREWLLQSCHNKYSKRITI
jgi:hypothetical protein